MANGRVITGFSMPRVAIYSNEGNTVTYSNGMPLARGVEVSIEPEVGEDNNFYADNVIAESVGGVFNGGTVSLTVDGLLDTAEALVYGLPAVQEVPVGGETVNVRRYGESMVVPYVGIGFVIRYMSDGITSYVPVVLNKARFQVGSTSAATQTESIEWQTQEMTADLFRDDATDHAWKTVGEEQTSEAAAVAVIDSLLGVTA